MESQQLAVAGAIDDKESCRNVFLREGTPIPCLWRFPVSSQMRLARLGHLACVSDGGHER